ncbi:MAG: type III pantothenate kinase [Flavobacteriales bacterium]
MTDMPLDLVLDVGNTRTKLALFQGQRVVRSGHMVHGDRTALQGFVAGDRPDSCVIGSVGHSDPSFIEHLRSLAPVLVVTGGTPTPLLSSYSTPLTLGADRLANAVAVAARFPGRSALAIDLGTCITYDLVRADRTYAGGAIAPGLRMRAQAMHDHSAMLPLVDPSADPPALGTSTQGSLEAGLHHGIVAELRGFIQAYTHGSPDTAVVLTGGDALRFTRALKSGIFALPLLTLEGLHAILDHHRALHGVPAGNPSGSR